MAVTTAARGRMIELIRDNLLQFRLGNANSPASESPNDGGTFPNYSTQNDGMTPTSDQLFTKALSPSDVTIDYVGETAIIDCVVEQNEANGSGGSIVWTEVGVFGQGDVLLTREIIPNPPTKDSGKRLTYKVIMTL